MSNPKRPSLVKQLLGALIGASLALVLYGGYKVSAPALQGVLVLPQSLLLSPSKEPVRVASTNVDEGNLKRIVSKAKRIADDFGLGEHNNTETVVLDTQADEPTHAAAPEVFEISDPWEEEWDSGDAHENVEQWKEPEDAWDDFTAEWDSFPANEEPTPMVASHAESIPTLPESGLGLSLAGAMAFSAAYTTHRRRKASSGL